MRRRERKRKESDGNCIDCFATWIRWFRFGTIVDKIWKHLVDERADKFGPVEGRHWAGPWQRWIALFRFTRACLCSAWPGKWGEGKCTGTRERTRCIRWSLGSANYEATRTGRCYYRLGPFVFGVYVHRRRRPRPRLCLLTNSATIALSQSRMHRRTRILQGPCETLFAPFLCVPRAARVEQSLLTSFV